MGGSRRRAGTGERPISSVANGSVLAAAVPGGGVDARRRNGPALGARRGPEERLAPGGGRERRFERIPGAGSRSNGDKVGAGMDGW
jgi:hypothetical protein